MSRSSRCLTCGLVGPKELCIRQWCIPKKKWGDAVHTRPRPTTPLVLGGVARSLCALLVQAIRKANARRQQLLRTQRAVAMAADNDRTTLMLVVVAAVMLIVEFPMVVLLLLILGSWL